MRGSFQKLFMATFISQIHIPTLFPLSCFWSCSYVLNTYQQNCSTILILSLLVLLSGSAFIPPLSFPHFPHICLSHFITTSLRITSVCLVLHSLSQAQNTLSTSILYPLFPLSLNIIMHCLHNSNTTLFNLHTVHFFHIWFTPTTFALLFHAEATEQQRTWSNGRALQLASLLIRELSSSY